MLKLRVQLLTWVQDMKFMTILLRVLRLSMLGLVQQLKVSVEELKPILTGGFFMVLTYRLQVVPIIQEHQN